MKIDGKLVRIWMMTKRKGNGLNQEELSEKIGLLKNHISNIERAKYIHTTA